MTTWLCWHRYVIDMGNGIMQRHGECAGVVRNDAGERIAVNLSYLCKLCLGRQRCLRFVGGWRG